MSIFVCGALHYDVIVTADRFPRPDETLFGDDVTYRLGGKGGNQAISAAAMGSSVAMAGTIGSDAYAAQMIADLSAGNVDVSQISHPKLKKSKKLRYMMNHCLTQTMKQNQERKLSSRTSWFRARSHAGGGTR